MVFREFKDITFCEQCGNESISVNDTRVVKKIRRRRRICTLCGHRTTTYEISKEDLEMLIAKENVGIAIVQALKKMGELEDLEVMEFLQGLKIG